MVILLATRDGEDQGKGTMFVVNQHLTLDLDRVVWRDVGEEVVILDVQTATYLTLNGSGQRLWKQLERGSSPGALASLLVEAFGISDIQAEGDVQAFLEDLNERGLLATDK